MISPQLALDFGPAVSDTSSPHTVKPGKRCLVDLFAGSGGFLTGTMWAAQEIGIPLDAFAINHDPRSRDTHKLNYPSHTHRCTKIERTGASEMLPGQVVFHQTGSPCCTGFSSAAAGRPVKPQMRSTARHYFRWVKQGRPLAFHMENVAPFENWGPERHRKHKDGKRYMFTETEESEKAKAPQFGFRRPKGMQHRKWLSLMAAEGYEPVWEVDPNRLGENFLRLIHDFRKVGYDVEWRVINAADYGAATSRRRLIVYGVRRDTGMKNVWPAAFCADPDKKGGLPKGCQPHVGADTAVDTTKRGMSIFERPRPLKRKTILRILDGFFKYGLPELMKSAESRSRYLTKFYGTSKSAPLTAPMPTITASGTHLGLAEAFLVQVAHGRSDEENASSCRIRSIRQPLPTICGNRGEWSICESFLLSQQSGGAPRPVSKPVPTIATGGAIALCSASGAVPDDDTGEIVDLSDPDAKKQLKQIVLRLASNPGSGKPTVVFKGRKTVLDFFHRMLDVLELARAQSFPDGYQFAGGKTDAIWLIGNSVPPLMARALLKAHWTQNPDVRLPSAPSFLSRAA